MDIAVCVGFTGSARVTRAFVAAGSVITRNIPADALSIARAQQVDKPGRAKEIRARLRRKD